MKVLHRAIRNKGLWYELSYDEMMARLEAENEANQKLIRENKHERTSKPNEAV